MLRDTFNDLATEFSAAADKAIKTDAQPLLLLTRFSALLRYKAQSTDEKEVVTAALFNKGMELLNSFAPPAKQEAIVTATRRAHAANTKNYAQMIFNRLLETDSLPYLPENAAEMLADTTLALARCTESINRDNFKNGYHTENEAAEYKKALHALADLSLAYADKVAAAKAASSTAAVIGQKIATPAAKIQLRQPGT